MYAQCFSFIPYAHNGVFSHLPKNKEFCVTINDLNYYFKTSINSSRLISKKTDSQNIIYSFGDSQMLGIDWTYEKNKPHDLETIFKTKKISIFAAPNNGPFQAISQAKSIFRKRNTTKVSKLVFSFNFGTDIFRIQEKWDLQNFIPIKSEDLDKVLINPLIYDLVLLKGVLSGKFFSTNLPDNKSIISEFTKLNFYETEKRINLWINKIRRLKKKTSKDFFLVIYPPYWIFDRNGLIIDKKIHEYFIKFTKNVSNRNIFNKIYVGNLLEKNFLTFDKRHFKTGSLFYASK